MTLQEEGKERFESAQSLASRTVTTFLLADSKETVKEEDVDDDNDDDNKTLTNETLETKEIRRKKRPKKLLLKSIVCL